MTDVSPPADFAPLEPTPPAALRTRVAGTDDLAWFGHSGALSVGEWRRALSVVGRDIASFATIMDYGCGCGRTLRWIKPLLQPHQKLIGADPDREAVEWIRGAYPGIEAIALAPIPPVSLADGAVELVLCHSVFTHLPENVQYLWLEELWRIMRPGGYAVVSFHGEKAFSDFTDAYTRAGNVAAAVTHTQSLRDKGHLYVALRAPAEESLPDYYGAAFHTIDYIQRNWGRSFRLRAWLPRFALDHQDVVVLHKPEQ